MKQPPAPPAEPDVHTAVLGIIASMLIVVLNNAETIDPHVVGESGRTIWDVFRRAIAEVEVIDHKSGREYGRTITLRGPECEYRIQVRKINPDYHDNMNARYYGATGRLPD